MCTALSYYPNGHYFGRNLDLEVSYGQQVVITPRHFNFKFRKVPDIDQHFAMIGVATVIDNYPLYFDAANEKGLAMAGLNYPDNAYYPTTKQSNKDNITPFEFIPWVLSKCATVQDARELVANINLIGINFSEQLPLSPLHWLIADDKESIVIESDHGGLHVYSNPVGVLTNNPRFDKQLFNLNNYRNLSSATLENTFAGNIDLKDYSRGLGTRGLPGGMDSESRFVRATFNKFNAHWDDSTGELTEVNELFHIMHSVEQQSGLDQVTKQPAQFEYTIYTVGYNLDQGRLYYTTYTNNQINCVDMNKVDLNSDIITTYPFIDKQNINYLN